MTIEHSGLAVSELIGALAADASRAKAEIESQGLAFQMPELSAQMKVAFSVRQGDGGARLNIQTAKQGRSNLPLGTLSTRLVACAKSHQSAAEITIVEQTFVNQALCVTIKLSYQQAMPAAFEAVDINLDRTLAASLNGNSLSVATAITQRQSHTDQQGLVNIVVQLDPSDSGAVLLPITVAGAKTKQTFLFTTEL